jgi:hypothetical protein
MMELAINIDCSSMIKRLSPASLVQQSGNGRVGRKVSHARVVSFARCILRVSYPSRVTSGPFSAPSTPRQRWRLLRPAAVAWPQPPNSRCKPGKLAVELRLLPGRRNWGDTACGVVPSFTHGRRAFDRPHRHLRSWSQRLRARVVAAIVAAIRTTELVAMAYAPKRLIAPC